MPQILRADSCSTCFAAYRNPEGHIECRLNPPMAHPIFIHSPKGPQLAGQFAGFPIVQPVAWCRQYRRGVLREDLQSVTAQGVA